MLIAEIALGVIIGLTAYTVAMFAIMFNPVMYKKINKAIMTVAMSDLNDFIEE